MNIASTLTALACFLVTQQAIACPIERRDSTFSFLPPADGCVVLVRATAPDPAHVNPHFDKAYRMTPFCKDTEEYKGVDTSVPPFAVKDGEYDEWIVYGGLGYDPSPDKIIPQEVWKADGHEEYVIMVGIVTFVQADIQSHGE